MADPLKVLERLEGRKADPLRVLARMDTTGSAPDEPLVGPPLRLQDVLLDALLPKREPNPLFNTRATVEKLRLGRKDPENVGQFLGNFAKGAAAFPIEMVGGAVEQPEQSALGLATFYPTIAKEVYDAVGQPGITPSGILGPTNVNPMATEEARKNLARDPFTVALAAAPFLKGIRGAKITKVSDLKPEAPKAETPTASFEPWRSEPLKAEGEISPKPPEAKPLSLKEQFPKEEISSGTPASTVKPQGTPDAGAIPAPSTKQPWEAKYGVPRETPQIATQEPTGAAGRAPAKVVAPPVEPKAVTPVQASNEIGRAALPREVKPPKPPDEVIGAPEEGVVGIKNAEVERIRADFPELETMPEPQRKSMWQSLEEAKIDGADKRALDIADDVAASKRPLESKEVGGLVLKHTELLNEYEAATKTISDLIERGNTKGAEIETARRAAILENIDKVQQAATYGGTEQARAFQLRKAMINRESMELAPIMERARTAKGKPLTVEETAKIEKLAADYKAVEGKLKEVEAAHDKLLAEQEKIVAERVAEQLSKKATITTKAARSRAKLQAERADIKKQLEAIGYRVNDITGVTAEGSYLIGRLAVNYIREGAVNLNEVVQKVLADIPEITERDVWKALNERDPKRQKAVRSETQKRVDLLKKQARLLDDIKSAEEGVFAKRPGISKNRPLEIRRLQAQLTKLRREAYRQGNNDLQSGVLERTIFRINEAQDMLANQYRATKKGKTIPSEEVAEARKKLQEIRTLMRTQDRLADLNEQLRTGDFKIKTPETVKEAPRELEQARIQVKKAKTQVQQAIEDMRPWDTKKAIGEVIHTQRTLKATGDISFTFRQLVVPALGHPFKTAKFSVRALKAMFSENRGALIDSQIRNRPTNYLGEKAGLKILDYDSPVMGQRADIFRARLIERIPVLGDVIKASNRHATTIGNLFRSSLFDDFVRRYPNATTAELKAYANTINVMSGIGDLGNLGKTGKAIASGVLWSPELTVSRFQTPYKLVQYWKEPRVRAQIAKEYTRFVMSGLGLLTLAKLAWPEATVGTDPRSADFGKVRYGNTRFDIWGGFQQPARLIARIGLAATDRAGFTGRELKAQEKQSDPWDLVSQFAEYKLSPSIGIVRESLTGKTAVGEKTDIPQTLLRSVLPLVVDDIKDAYKEAGFGRAIGVGGLVMTGVGVSTYPDNKTATRKKISTLVKDGKIAEAFKIQREWNTNNPKNHIKIIPID